MNQLMEPGKIYQISGEKEKYYLAINPKELLTLLGGVIRIFVTTRKTKEVPGFSVKRLSSTWGVPISEIDEIAVKYFRVDRKEIKDGNPGRSKHVMVYRQARPRGTVRV